MASHHLPFVIFQVKAGLYGVGSENVREIVMLPKVSTVPDLPPEIRGVINLRGKVMPLVDLRLKLGLPSAKAELDELIQLLHDREKDHCHWLTELETCVRERRPFTLGRDPHACKFGQWFDHFQTDHTLLKMTLKKMDEPHQRIHGTAKAALELAEGGDQAGALTLLEDRRQHELAVLIKLFEEARWIISDLHRELAVVLSRGDKRFAICIDAVEAVERIPEENIEPLPAALDLRGTNVTWQIGKRVKTNQTIVLLDEDFLFYSEAANPLPASLATAG